MKGEQNKGNIENINNIFKLAPLLQGGELKIETHPQPLQGGELKIETHH